jgi:subtilisin-like proprotein convertase family protein
MAARPAIERVTPANTMVPLSIAPLQRNTASAPLAGSPSASAQLVSHTSALAKGAVVSTQTPDVALLERKARQDWAAKNPAQARTASVAGSYEEVAHLVRRSNWEALSKTHRAMVRKMVWDARAGVVGVMPCFAPGTNPKTVQAFESINSSLQFFRAGTYWTNTAAGLHAQGAPLTLRWSVVPDGTALPAGDAEPAAPSNLRARLNAIYGSETVWRPLIRQVFTRWSEVAGVRYIEELNDDGIAMTNTTANPGVAGVRGDVRIGGHSVDGVSGILAFNYFPDNGDMVIDTDDMVAPSGFFINTSGNSLGLRNVLAHEHGHGLAFSHVCPVDETKLMEPFVSRNFDGPQIDDIQNAHRGYGDPLEENDSQSGGTNLGTLGNGTTTRTGVSLDSNTDQDFYRFSVSSSKLLTATVQPQGGSYLEGPQTSACTGTTFNAGAQRNLALAVLDSSGTVVAQVNSTGVGGVETLSSVRLAVGSGPYAIRVSGDTTNSVQLYSLNLSLSDAPPGAAFTQNGAVTINDTTGNGNRNGLADPGEASLGLTIPLRNVGDTNATGVVGTLVSLTTGVTVVQANATYPNINASSTTNNSTQPVISLASNFSCGSTILLRLDVQSNQGSSSVNLTLSTGTSTQNSFTYSGASVTIPDATSTQAGAIATATILVSGSGPISDIDFKLDNLTHTFVGDLALTLTSPSGTTVTLIDSMDGGNNSGNNFVNTVLDDEASNSIENQTAAAAPFTGSFLPASALAAFDGQSANGTWTVRIQDFAQGDLGALNTFSLRISTLQCTAANTTLPVLSINDASASEGNLGTNGVTFTVTLAPASSQTVTVNFATSNGTATAGSDYTSTSGTLTFAPGDTSKPINVPAVGDTTVEPNETFTVNLTTPVNATIGDSQGTGTIINDDSPRLAVTDTTVFEGNSGSTNATVNVSLTPSASQTVTVSYATSNGTATSGSDYASTSGTLTFTAGQTSKTINIPILGDTTSEPNETINVTLTSPTNATLSDGSGLVTITNDDGVSSAPPRIFISAPAKDKAVSVLSNISGQAADASGSGLNRVEVVLKRNSDNLYWTGTTWGARTLLTTTLNGGNWTRTGGLPSGTFLLEGQYTIAATVFDNNAGSKSTSIFFRVDKTLPTSVTITTPANGSTITGFTSINGTATDNPGGTGIVRMDVILKRNSDGKYWTGTTWGARKLLTVAISGNNWNVTSTLPNAANTLSGTYLVAAYAYDLAMNAITANSNVTVNKFPPPAISITSPGSNKAVSNLDSIFGRVVDNSQTGINRVEIVLKRNSDSKYWTGSVWGARTLLTTTVSAGTWTRNAGLPNGTNLVEGAYTLAASVFDNSGGTKSTSILFTVDKTLPTALTIASPANGSSLTALSAISGTVSDNAGGTGITRMDVVLKRNSDAKYWTGTAWGARKLLSVSISGSSWSVTNVLPGGANLTAGGYLVAAYAYDRANNSVGANSNFTVPAPGIQTAESPYTLSTAAIISNGVQLTFTGAVDASSATNPASYDILVDGRAVAVERATLQSSTVVGLNLPQGSLSAGDSVVVAYTLVDNRARRLTGKASVTIH